MIYRLVAAFLLLVVPPATSPKPVHHFVFFGGNREAIRTDSAFLTTKAIEGAQIIYTWKSLEPGEDEYDFSAIRDDLAFLTSHGKKLWIQLQDVTFSPDRINVPKYLTRDSIYHGGAARQYRDRNNDNDPPVPLGWLSRRWDPAVQARLHKLFAALGSEFDGKIAGINLPETSIGFAYPELFPEGYSHVAYRDAIITNMKALKRAFPRSVAMQYANFMPGEYRATNDRGYLVGVYNAAEEFNVGVGGPDLLPFHVPQLQSSYPLIREASGIVPTGIAVQDGDYDDVDRKTGKRASISELLDFASDYLRVDYIFWCTQEPFYSKELIPFLSGRANGR